VGKSIRDIKFRSRYNAVVLAVHREGVRVHARVGDVVGLYMLNAVDP
jgi:Trk K+ transport system NAD-binding subunit